ncbi:response regulator [Micromonospora sp. STR1s_5]|nr:response regulator [Micromonospora sp. STR1s_5]
MRRFSNIERPSSFLTNQENDAAKPPVVLVAEDEALIRMSAADQLELEGYEVLEAGNAAEALAMIQARPEVQVLFTDIDMPGDLNGMGLAEQVHQRWPEVLLLVTSGRQSLSDDDVPDDGMFVAKPYAGEELSGALKGLFRRHRPVGRETRLRAVEPCLGRHPRPHRQPP